MLHEMFDSPPTEGYHNIEIQLLLENYCRELHQEKHDSDGNVMRGNTESNQPLVDRISELAGVNFNSQRGNIESNQPLVDWISELAGVNFNSQRGNIDIEELLEKFITDMESNGLSQNKINEFIMELIRIIRK